MFAMKVAVAIAVIKGKPDNLSGQQFAESLQRKLSLKRVLLEKDFVEARLKITKLETQLPKSDTLCKETGDDTSYILTPPLSSNSLHKTQSNTEGFQNRCNVESISSDIENSKFIQNVVNLEKLNSSLHNHQQSDDIKRAVAENISTLSDVLSTDIIALPEACLCKAAESITLLLHRYLWLKDSEHTMEAVCRLIETVLFRIKQPSNHHQYPPHRQKHSFMHMLVVCMVRPSDCLTVLIMDSLMDAWEEFCQELQTSRVKRRPVDPQVLESNFFVIRAVELAAKSWTNQCDEDLDILHNLQERLDRSLLLISDFFPLVTRAVWKVTGVIETILLGHKTRV